MIKFGLFQGCKDSLIDANQSMWYTMLTDGKIKLQANVTDEQRCKNPQENFSKQNLETHQKSHIPWSSWVYPRDARILQYAEINQCDAPY